MVFSAVLLGLAKRPPEQFKQLRLRQRDTFLVADMSPSLHPVFSLENMKAFHQRAV